MIDRNTKEALEADISFLTEVLEHYESGDADYVKTMVGDWISELQSGIHYVRSIPELSKVIHQNNIEKGFYDTEKNIGEMLALIHSEVSEALEADRINCYAPKIESGTIEFYPIRGLNKVEDDSEFQVEFERTVKDTFNDELADIMIRVMDLAEHKSVNLEAHLIAKIRYNKLRPYKHGKNY